MASWRPAIFALVPMLLFSGCVRVSIKETFETDLSSDWTPHGGTWRIVDTTEGRVLEGRGAADPGLSSLVNADLGFMERFDLRVDVGLLSGTDPQGAGVVVNWQDHLHYVIVRYSTHEHGWHLFTVVDGVRTKQPNATVSNGTDPGFNVWMSLRVEQRAERIIAYENGAKVVEYRLTDADPKIGQAGLFVRGNSVAYFDDLRIEGT